ncbi:N utilization substance protein B [bacterium HR17]|jgi:N utilization substance protein B|uniref:Transcription antitermination protein NusB n=1 Tax=Candidatus Fervidibacter japonicus TaxID=2035412 RepID=A0A2H5X9T6_9BACT|nr:N utilization substance protein B [bacterium HR17]
MQGRRHAREIALQMLFQADVGNLPIDEAVEVTLADAPDLDESVRRYATALAKGVWAHRAELDAHLRAAAAHWSVERMAAVDRNLLRIALYEILFVDDVPYRVAINEAVELAKKYGGAESRRFVNGVLGAITRKLGLSEGKDRRTNP